VEYSSSVRFFYTIINFILILILILYLPPLTEGGS
jgi:hypothetical protein